MLLRSLALRDEAIALCDEAVVLMLLWKLAPISDISKVVSQQRCYVPESQNMRANGWRSGTEKSWRSECSSVSTYASS